MEVNVELRVLKYFLEVAREENITAAAESLHITQPTLSKQLMDLEDEIGKKLFIRGKRRITLTEDVENYHGFHLEVQNNEPHTDGADYAIDDVRIYKTLPNIEVYRNNNCDASTLIVGTDYATILRNMGWKADTDVASEGIYDYSDPDYLKYRYGLMGEDHEFLNSTVGNVYFSFWDATTQTWQAVNKAVEKYSNRAAKSLRVAVSTVQSKEPTGEGLKGWEFYTEYPDEAQEFEREMNLRALKDYQADWKTVWKSQGGVHATPMTQKVEDIGDPEDPDSFNEQLYQEALIELFGDRTLKMV